MSIHQALEFMGLEDDFISKPLHDQHEIIEDAYLSLCKRYHPDNQKTGDTELFKILQKYYETLKIFITMNQAESNIKSQSQEHQLFLRCSLEELYQGCDKSVKYGDLQAHVIIIPGTLDGQVIPVQFINSFGQHVITGSVKILQINNTSFQRDGCNLKLTLNITLNQALYNEPLTISMFNQQVKIPLKLKSSDHCTIIKGMGMPIVGSTTNEYGDLYVNYRVVFPSNINDLEEILDYAVY